MGTKPWEKELYSHSELLLVLGAFPARLLPWLQWKTVSQRGCRADYFCKLWRRWHKGVCFCTFWCPIKENQFNCFSNAVPLIVFFMVLIYCLQIELRKNRGGLVAKDANDSSRFGSLSDKDRPKQITKDRRQPIRDSSLKVTHILLNMQLLILTWVCF